MPPVPHGRRRVAALRLGIAILVLDVLAGLPARGMIGPGAAWRGALLATVIAGTPARARPAAARARACGPLLERGQSSPWRQASGGAVMIEIHEAALRLAVAVAAGTAIGAERQWRQRMAGLRTNALVALGACCFTLFGLVTPGDASPTRVAAQVVSGIGFLGAGVILREGLNVRGLNTAATLWCSAAIGVFAGAGALILAAAATAIIIGVNLGLRPLVRLIDRQPNAGAEVDRHYLVTLTCKSSKEAHIRALLLQAVAASDVKLRRLESSDEPGSGEAPAERVTVTADLIASGPSETWLEATVGRLCLEPSVTRAGWSEVKTG